MKKEHIDKLLARLKKEVVSSDETEIDAYELERLKNVAFAYQEDDRIISTKEIVDSIKLGGDEVVYKTGIKQLDDVIGGFTPKQLIILTASTKSGKTSFCIELAIRMKETNATFFSYEETPEELIRKFLERGEEPPMFYTPKKMTYKSLEWIESKIIEAHVKYNSKLFFIDHLHDILGNLNTARLDSEIGNTVRELKHMARRWNVTIVLIAHMRKVMVTEPPSLSDIRDSSFSAQYADTVLVLWRKTSKVGKDYITTNEVNVSVQANRRTGKTGNIKMVYDDGRFVEKDWSPESLDKTFNDF
jgi:replicative DNA helicase